MLDHDRRARGADLAAERRGDVEVTADLEPEAELIVDRARLSVVRGDARDEREPHARRLRDDLQNGLNAGDPGDRIDVGICNRHAET